MLLVKVGKMIDTAFSSKSKIYKHYCAVVEKTKNKKKRMKKKKKKKGNN